MPGRLGRGDPALADLVGGLLAQPGRNATARRHGWHRLGERLARAPRVAAFAPVLDPAQVHCLTGAAHVPRPGHHRLVHPVRDRAAIRACPGSLQGCDRPHLNPAVRSGFHAGDLQACHAEQRRCRILEHDGRGFLLILKSVGGPRS
jgi:hypothetical protein